MYNTSWLYIWFYLFVLYLHGLLSTFSVFTGTPTPLHWLFDVNYLHLLRVGTTTSWEVLSPPLFYFFSVFPDACFTSWDLLFEFSLAVLPIVWLMEGAWWTFFRWLQSSVCLGLLHLASIKEHQLFQCDVRFRFRASLNVTLTGFNTTLFRTAWSKRTSVPHHHQFHLSVRLRARIY